MEKYVFAEIAFTSLKSKHIRPLIQTGWRPRFLSLVVERPSISSMPNTSTLMPTLSKFYFLIRTDLSR